MYSPREIYQFMTSIGFRSIMNESFYKRHMETEEHKSPFDNPESIIFLEWLIDHNYVIAEYRSDHGSDNEIYLISTLGHAFVQNYARSAHFRLRAHYQFYKTLYWILFASGVGSLIANYITYLIL
jgi:hypothetical protein